MTDAKKRKMQEQFINTSSVEFRQTLNMQDLFPRHQRVWKKTMLQVKMGYHNEFQTC